MLFFDGGEYWSTNKYQEKQRRLLNQQTKPLAKVLSAHTHWWKDIKNQTILINITEKKIQIFIYTIKQVKIIYMKKVPSCWILKF